MTSPGAQLAALRKQAVKVCPECGNTFTGYVSAEVCSSRCRVRKHRKKQKPAGAG